MKHTLSNLEFNFSSLSLINSSGLQFTWSCWQLDLVELPGSSERTNLLDWLCIAKGKPLQYALILIKITLSHINGNTGIFEICET